MALTQVTSGLISSVSNTAISGLITSAQIASVANTQVTGLMTASQIATVANTQVTGLITSGQIASVANTQITGVMTASQIATVANTQVTGLITSAQIASVANTQITGILGTSNGGTGINSFGTGVQTALGQSVTGSGSIVLATSPTLVTPVLGTPTSGNLSNTTVDGTNSVGFLNIPINSQSAAYTLVLADAGKAILHPSTDANARTFTIPANSSVAYPVGTAISFINMTSNVVSIAITTDTMYLSSAGTTGTRSLAQYGTATAVKMTSTTWLISGNGLT